MRLREIGTALVLTLLVILSLSGCQAILGEPKVIKSGEGSGSFQVTVPADWREDPELNENAAIRASKRRDELYIIVFSDSKEELRDAVMLDEFTKVASSELAKSFKSTEVTTPVPVLVNGTYPGMSYRIYAEANNHKVVYLITNVETPQAFHQIITWTLLELIDRNQSKLQQVTDTFKVNY